MIFVNYKYENIRTVIITQVSMTAINLNCLYN